MAIFSDTLGMAKPVVPGHSIAIVAVLCEARHPGRAGALILQSTMARFDLERLVAGFRAVRSLGAERPVRPPSYVRCNNPAIPGAEPGGGGPPLPAPLPGRSRKRLSGPR